VMVSVMGEHDIRAVIFDIDGTLVDSFDAYYEVFNRGIASFNVDPVSRGFLRDNLAKGLSLREILQKVFPSPIDDATYETCRGEIRGLFRHVELEGVKLFPGTEEVFRHLEGKGIKIGIATGRISSPEDEWLRFKRLGLDKYINAIVTSQEVEHRKPAPDAIIECARRLNVSTKNCIVVGDTESDIVAARRAGASAAAVTTGHEDEDVLLKAKPEIVCRTINDLIAYVESSSVQGVAHAL
jgi:phosphoglycolate phosphatase-like HAD superfamily hydrolase